MTEVSKHANLILELIVIVPAREDYIIYQGQKFQVEFYFTPDGRIPAKEYLEELSLDIKVKLLALVKYIAENGKIFDITKFRMVSKNEKIFEFKPLSCRFFTFFFEGKRIIITNGYRKKSQKVSGRDLQKAIDIKRDYVCRVGGGNYYGKNKNIS